MNENQELVGGGARLSLSKRAIVVVPRPDETDGGGEISLAREGGSVAAPAVPSDPPDLLPILLLELRWAWRRRMAAVEARKRHDQRLVAFLRDSVMVGDDKAARQAAADALVDAVADAFKAALAVAAAAQPAGAKRGAKHLAAVQDMAAAALAVQPIDGVEAIHLGVARAWVLPLLQARLPLEKAQAAAERDCALLAGRLPVAAWWRDNVQKDFGTLAFIIGEAQDLRDFPTWGHLASYLGHAPYEGRLGSTWKQPSRRPRALTAAEWTEAGYAAAKRSLLYVWAESTIKNKNSRFRKVYDAAKARLAAKNEAGGFAERAAELAAAATREGKKPNEANAAGKLSPAHIHRMALVKTESQLIRRVWKAWRRALSAEAVGGMAVGEMGR